MSYYVNHLLQSAYSVVKIFMTFQGASLLLKNVYHVKILSSGL
jgi:hypothetical protein